MATNDTIMHPVPEPPTDPPMESAHRSRHGAERPKTSPYASPIVQLMVGPENRAYHVPYDLLPNSHFTAFNCPGNAIYLPDLDEDTGHVLAHYLYTGTYQTLDCMVTSENEKLQIEFKRAVLAYVAARSLGLDGLEELAKAKTEHFGAKMSIVDIVEAIQKDFSRIPSDATWFHDYFRRKVDHAFDMTAKADSEYKVKLRANRELTSLEMHSLFDCIEDISLLKALANPLWRAYRNISLLWIEVSEVVDSIDEEVIKFNLLAAKEAAREGCVVAEEPTIEVHIETEPIEEVPTPEDVFEERGSAVEPEIQAEERIDDAYEEATVAFDMTKEEPGLMPQTEIASLPHAEPEPIPAEESTKDPWSDWGRLVPNKKKKSKEARVPDAVPSPTHENTATEPPFQLESTYEDVQQEEALQDHIPPTSEDHVKNPEDITPVSISNVEPEPENKESIGWPSTSILSVSKKKKKSKKSRAPEPEPEPVQVPTIDDPGPVQEMRSAEVDEKKWEEHIEHQVVPEEMKSVQKPPTTDIVEETVPVPIEQPQEDNSLSMSSTKLRKKDKKKKVLRTAKKGAVSTESEIAEPINQGASTTLIEENHSMPTESAGLNNGNTKAYPEGVSDQHVEVQGELCPWFNEHSQPGGQWKTCQTCQDYVLRVALDQFHRSVSNGVEVS